jgi:hypothetical protein
MRPQPAHNYGWILISKEDVEPPLGDPLAGVWPQRRSLGSPVWTSSGIENLRRTLAEPVDSKAQSTQDCPCLMGGEIGSIQAGDHRQDLFWREPPAR